MSVNFNLLFSFSMKFVRKSLNYVQNKDEKIFNPKRYELIPFVNFFFLLRVPPPPNKTKI